MAERLSWKPVGDRMLRGEFGSLVIKIEPEGQLWNGDVMGSARDILADRCRCKLYIRGAEAACDVQEWADNVAVIWKAFIKREFAATNPEG
jgi:hypothetical protein